MNHAEDANTKLIEVIQKQKLMAGKKKQVDKEIDSNKIKIKNLSNLENFGQINVCITDKTGTLTKNDLVVRTIYTDEQ